MDSQYYSNGKLLLTGEYLVLKGARALALPIKFGQSMEIILDNSKVINWQSYQYEQRWFRATFDKKMNILSGSNDKLARYLKKIIKQAQKINPDFIQKDFGYQIKTILNFNKEWGLGSSSSLISNIAYWAGIGPMQLFARVANGSGYDIACARSKKPIIYQIKNNNYIFESVNFDPIFKKHLYFVYLNKKQDSSKEVKKFNQNKISTKDLSSISELTQGIIRVRRLTKFNELIKKHEQIIAHVIGKEKVKDKYFKDFDGEVKSLGAWGGDFVLASSNLSEKNTYKYFNNKGFNTIFKFDQMLIN